MSAGPAGRRGWISARGSYSYNRGDLLGASAVDLSVTRNIASRVEPRSRRGRALRGGTRRYSWLLLGVVGLVGCSAQIAAESPAPGSAAASPVVASAPSAEEAASDQPATGEAGRGGADSESEAKEKASAEEVTAPVAPPADTYFEGRTEVSYKEFVDELRKIADDIADHPEITKAHAVLLRQKNLTAEELPLESFSRARLAFESARDSGLWGIRGTITDQMPWSDRVWEQWNTRKFTPGEPVAEGNQSTFPTAEGECDELGALFSVLARDMGVVGFVGLHWPYWNHVVPVWQVNKKDGTFVRIIVPATQTFLDKKETIGTTGHKTNRVVFPYVRKDRKEHQKLNADLARYLLTQSREHGTLSTEKMTMRRLWHRWNNRPGAPEKKILKSAAPKAAAGSAE